MIQLRILSGQMAGDLQVIRRFPFYIGRAAGNNLCLPDDGVWDNHLSLEFKKDDGFILHTAGDAFAAINDQPQTTARLRNGDIISFGSAKMQFWLAAPRQRGLHFREMQVWALLAGVTVFQLVLLYRLLR